MIDLKDTNASTANASAIAAGAGDMTFEAFQAPRSRRWMGRVCVGFASIVLMAGLGLAGLFMALSRGPIELPFLSERIAVGLEQQLGAGIDVEVGRTVLEKNENGLGLHVLDIVLKEAHGREILRSPDAIVSFKPSQLLRMSIAPDRLALRGMAMRAEITAEGEVFFTTAGASSPSTTRFSDVVAAVIGIGAPDASDGWSAISIADASLVIEDRRNGKQLAFENMSLAFGSPRAGVLEATGSLRKERDTVRFSLLAEPAPDGRRLKLGFSDVGDSVIQALLGAKTPYLRMAAKFGAGADFALGADGRIKTFVLEATMGAGFVEAPAVLPTRLNVDRLSLRADWNAAQPKRAALDARFEGDGFKLHLSGPLSVPESGLHTWGWEAAGGGWVLPALARGDQPVLADKVEFRAEVDPGAKTARLTAFTLEGPATRIALTGEAAIEDQGLGFRTSVEAGRMPLRTALRWWPSFISPEARGFLTKTVRDGDMTRLALDVAMQPEVLQKAIRQEALPRESVKLAVAVENGIMELSEGMPLIVGLQGQGTLDALQAQGVFQSGSIEAKAGRRVQMTEGSFNLDGLDTTQPTGRFKFKATGSLEGVAEILRAPDLRAAHGIDIDPANVKGQFDGAVSLTLPLTDRLTAANVAVLVEGRMTGVTVEKAIGKDKLENATLTVSTDRTGIEVKGEGRWQGTPVTLGLENDAATGTRTAVLSMTLDDAAMKRRGFSLQGQLQGPLPVKIRSRTDPRESAKMQVEVDLTRAAIDGLLPGLQKPAGRPGKLSFDASERANGFAIQNIALDTGPSQFRGQAEANADGAIASARFSLFRLSPGDNVKLDYDRSAAGAKVTIRGNNLDARPFLRAATQPEAGTRKEGDLDLDVKTTLLSGHGGEVLTSAEARIGMRGAQLRQLDVTGKLNGRAVSLTGRGTGSAPIPITIESDDAGALLRFFDFYGRMAGGELSGQVMASPRRSTGYVIAKDFTLRNEPAIRRLVAGGQTEGGRQDSGDAQFTKMRVDFTREGTEIAVKDAVIFGPQLGLTFNGMVDPTRDRVSLSGTYVPAYGLNNAFAQIPLVGNLLTGGRNEGLLAVTFGVSGRASQPTVSVNPLSAVAPGIFRKIFEFRNDRTGAVPPPAFNPAAN